MRCRLHPPVRRGATVPKVQFMDKTTAFTHWDFSDEAGVTAIEYGLLAALIAVAIIGGVSATGASLLDVYDKWTTAVIQAVAGKL